jgi:hypothetical protein
VQLDSADGPDRRAEGSHTKLQGRTLYRRTSVGGAMSVDGDVAVGTSLLAC